MLETVARVLTANQNRQQLVLPSETVTSTSKTWKNMFIVKN